MATERVMVFKESPKKATPVWLWLLPLLLLLAIGAWLLTRHKDQQDQPATSAMVAGDATKPDAAAGTATAVTVWTAASISDAIEKNGRVAFNDTDVHFATASASLAGDSQTVLDQTAQALKDNSD